MYKILFLYILSLLAGKFGKICTALPLATNLAKKLTGYSLNISRSQKNLKSGPTNFTRQININHLGKKLKASVNFCSISGQFKKRAFEIFNETFVLVKFHFRDGFRL